MKLYEFQEQGRDYLLSHGFRGILNYDTGLGKTPTTIAALKGLPPGNVLVAGPAMVRQNWKDKLDEWWPEHPEVGMVTKSLDGNSMSGKERERQEQARTMPIQITSYNMLKHLTVGQKYDYIVFDELHRLQSHSVQWSRAAAIIAEGAKGVVGLTATPIPDQPKQIWHQMDIVYPGRFGSWPTKMEWNRRKTYTAPWKFCDRYCNWVEGTYGGVFTGVNEENADELALRLSGCWHRVTQDEVAHLLPALRVSTLRVTPDRTGLRVLKNLGADMLGSKKEMGMELERLAHKKFPFVEEWLQDNNSGDNLCILAYHRKLAKALATMARRKGINVFHVDGTLPTRQRDEILKRARATPGSLLVATMKSVGIGIDLGFCRQVLFAEMWYHPETMIQALGRFTGFRTQAGANVTFMVVQGTLDEVIAHRLQSKIEDINALQKQGFGEGKILDALDLSEDEFLAAAQESLEVYVDEFGGYFG